MHQCTVLICTCLAQMLQRAASTLWMRVQQGLPQGWSTISGPSQQTKSGLGEPRALPHGTAWGRCTGWAAALGTLATPRAASETFEALLHESHMLWYCDLESDSAWL